MELQVVKLTVLVQFLAGLAQEGDFPLLEFVLKFVETQYEQQENNVNSKTQLMEMVVLLLAKLSLDLLALLRSQQYVLRYVAMVKTWLQENVMTEMLTTIQSANPTAQVLSLVTNALGEIQQLLKHVLKSVEME